MEANWQRTRLLLLSLFVYCLSLQYHRLGVALIVALTRYTLHLNVYNLFKFQSRFRPTLFYRALTKLNVCPRPSVCFCVRT